MNYLYLLLNIGSLSVPFLFSFHPKLKFYKYWKSLAISIAITMLFYIPWDVLFTQNGFWGFNDTYFLGQKFLGLPIEEWLFFICIPYACVFTHHSLLYYFPHKKLSEGFTKKLSYCLIILFLFLSIFFYSKWYTLVNFSYAVILLLLVIKYNLQLLRTYYLTFIVMLIPFFIVNGILTGSCIENEVVWYNDAENLGIRLFTIPIEDSIYAFTLILTNLVLTEFFQSKLLNK